MFGVGPETSGQRLASAGDNPEHMWSEGVFTHLAGVAPIPASSGRTHRHRLNRDGARAVQEGHHALPQATRHPRSPPRPDQHTGHAHHSKRPRSSCLTALGASRERKTR
ncbi:transposase [Streptomyces sp. 110]|uniref:Transposase n=1 Tax=Streptomyces endocoffeicus TaxID=2898945 RepID=A0ABS1PSS5_9ACTN|nr:transposase [Streptomyces endocoffeicus]